MFYIFEFSNFFELFESRISRLELSTSKSGSRAVNSSGSMIFHVKAASLKVHLSLRATASKAASSLLDIGIAPVSGMFAMNDTGSQMRAVASFGSVSGENRPELLSLQCDEKQMLSAEW